MLPVWLTDTVTGDLDRALHYTLLWGLEGVELRRVGGAGERVPFVNEEKLKRRLREHELPATAVSPGLFEGPAAERAVWMNEVASFDETLVFCNRVGCPRVVVGSFAASDDDGAASAAADALRRAGAAAARRGVRLAVRNDAAGAHATGAALDELLARVDHPAVRAAWDPCAALHAGEDPGEGLGRLADRVELVRCADGIVDGEAWRAAPLGEGAVDWPGQFRRLAAAGFDGPVSLEVHVEPRPQTGLRDATTMIRLIRAARRG